MRTTGLGGSGLDAGTRAGLDAVSAPPAPDYPYGFIDEVDPPGR